MNNRYPDEIMRAEIDLEVGYPDAEIVYRALLPEPLSSPSERSSVRILREGSCLKLTIDAEDLVSLRAAINTWLRLVRIAEEMIDLLECEV